MLTPTKVIEVGRLFAIEEPLEYFFSMAQAVLSDAATPSGRIALSPLVNGVIAKTAHAECGFTTGTGNQAEPILFVDLSLVELLSLVLTIVLPQFVPFTKTQRGALVERMLFHGAIRAGAYNVLDDIDPMPSLLSFGDKALAPSIALRTMVGLDCIIGHELGHWHDRATVPNFLTSVQVRQRVIKAAKAGYDRKAQSLKSRYPVEELEALRDGLVELAYWEGPGWSEIKCDLIGLGSAWNTSKALDVPVASFATTTATVFQIVGTLSLVAAVIAGVEDEIGPRVDSRSVIFESALNEMALAVGVPADVWSRTVSFRKRANRRFVDLIATPLFERAKELRKHHVALLRPSMRNLLASARRHGYAPRPAGHIYFAKGTKL